jgi:hypothetical protein
LERLVAVSKHWPDIDIPLPTLNPDTMSHVQEAAAKIAALEGKPTDDAESYELEGIFDYNSDTEEEEDFDHVDGGLYQLLQLLCMIPSSVFPLMRRTNRRYREPKN